MAVVPRLVEVVMAWIPLEADQVVVVLRHMATGPHHMGSVEERHFVVACPSMELEKAWNLALAHTCCWVELL